MDPLYKEQVIGMGILSNLKRLAITMGTEAVILITEVLTALVKPDLVDQLVTGSTSLY